MDVPIVLTPAQIVTGFLAVCAGISAIGAAIGWIIKAVNHIKKPNREQNERLDALEKKVAEFEGFFKADKERLESLSESNRMTQRALLALLSHGIDGNNTDEMIRAKDELTSWLIEK